MKRYLILIGWLFLTGCHTGPVPTNTTEGLACVASAIILHGVIQALLRK